jgi:hypothetical protein
MNSEADVDGVAAKAEKAAETTCVQRGSTFNHLNRVTLGEAKKERTNQNYSDRNRRVPARFRTSIRIHEGRRT